MKSQDRQLLGAWNPADLAEPLAVSPEEMVNTDVLAGDLESEVVWEVADLTGGPELGSQANISATIGIFIRGALRLVLFDSRLPTYCRWQYAMCAILEERVGAPESTLLSNKTRIGKM